MCGIIGYVGQRNAVEVIINGLTNLEYRGYDSSGISVMDNGEIKTVKTAGRLENLIAKIMSLKSDCSIGHTRWATHGIPNDVNSHPHTTDSISLVHNGIIENYLEIKKFLKNKNYDFSSQTDTEAGAKLVDCFYKDGFPMLDAVKKACDSIEGSYAFGIMCKNEKAIYCARRESPLIIAKGEGEHFIASDISAILDYTKEYYLMENNEYCKITKDKAVFYDKELNIIEKPLQKATWDVSKVQKNGFDHFMLKEIYEQPKALHDTVSPRIVDKKPSFDFDGLPKGYFAKFNSIRIVACGTAMHAGLVGKSLIENMSRIPVTVDLASEFRYSNPILDESQLLIIVSQSGETADSLAAMRMAQSKGIHTLAIVNVIGSSMAREAEHTIHTIAGPEIAVASTKAYIVQMSILYLIAIVTAWENGRISSDQAEIFTSELLQTIEKTSEVLKMAPVIKEKAKRYKEVKSLFFLGRGLDYALAQEGSLKLKEISYIHCEAYAAGELKHGTISLITEDTPVVALLTQDSVALKTLSNIKEVTSRGAKALVIAKEGIISENDTLYLPAQSDLFMPLLTVIPLQLLAYYTAIIRECDVDKPRNLAKSVTVE